MPARGSAGRTGTGTTPARDTAISAASMIRAPSLPAPPEARKRAVICSAADCGMERDEGVLERVGTERADDVRGHEEQLVADVDLAAPDVRLDVRRRQPAVAVRIRKRRETRAAVEVRLRRSDRADVQLVVADHRKPDADRAGAIPERAALAGVGEALVRDLDGLDEADPDPRGLVVVVLAPDRVGHEAGGVAGPRSGDAGRHQQEEMALGPRLGAHARLHMERCVRRIWGALGVGDDTELHLEPVGHWGPLPGCLVGRGLSHGACEPRTDD